MPKFKTYALSVVALALFIILAGAIWERAYIERIITFSGYNLVTLPVDWYTPQETVQGDQEDSLPIAAEDDRAIPDTVLRDITQFAEEQGSLSLIVLYKGEIQLEQYWEDANRNTKFNPQSMSKSVLALLMGIAIDEGFIDSVNDPIGKYVEEWRDDPRGAATIEQTLRMTAGLEQMANTYETNIFSRATRYNMGSDFDSMIFDLKQVDQPGTKFDYNNEETNLLGILIERATGKRYTEYLSEKLWQPLGLSDATMYLDRPNGSVMKSCCIFSRAYDWAKLGLLVSQKGTWNGEQLVPSQWIEAMITPSPLTDYYGYLVWLGSNYALTGIIGRPSITPPPPEGFHTDDMIVFVGFGEQRVWISPSNDLVIVRGTRQWAPSWNEMRIPNLALDAIAATDTESEKSLN
jgi:CubicO group peptidase (beta-lactamase class C family)